MEEADFGEYVEVGVGGEAVGADGDADAAGEKLTKRMRRMAEGGVSARAVDDGGVVRDGRAGSEKVAVNDQGRARAVEKSQNVVRVFRQPFRVPNAEVAQEGNERPAPRKKKFLLRRRFGEVNGDGHAAGGGGKEERGAHAVGRMGADAGAAGRRRTSGGEPAVETFPGSEGAVLGQPKEFAEDDRPKRRLRQRVPAAAVAGDVAEQRRAEPQAFGQPRPDIGLHLFRRTVAAERNYFP